MHYAHTLEGRPPEDWEALEDHLHLVAEGKESGFSGAAGFADAFGAHEWGRLLGLWHDLGKYSPEFQAYLRSSNGLVPEKTTEVLVVTRAFGFC